MPRRKPTSQPPLIPAEAYCTTAEAARLLGVGASSIQRFVDQGVLKAWKTHGGHRRISLASVEEFRGQRSQSSGRLSVLISDPTRKSAESLANALNDLGITLDVEVCGEGFQSLARLLVDHPNLWILAPEFKDIDGILIATKAACHSQLRSTRIVLCPSTPLESEVAQSLLSQGVIVLKKPYPVAQIQGIVTEMLARHTQEACAIRETTVSV